MFLILAKTKQCLYLKQVIIRSNIEAILHSNIWNEKTFKVLITKSVKL